MGITKARKVPGKPFASIQRFAPSVVGMYLQMLLFFIFPTNFAITASANASLSGQDITLIMVGLEIVAAIVGVFFGRMMMTMKRSMKYQAPVLFIMGYLAYSLGVSLFCLILGSVLVGVANGIGMPYLNTIASIKGGKDAATTVMPLISAALYLGQFTSPLIVSPLSHLIDSLTAPYMIGVIFGIIYLIQAFCTRKYQALAPVR